MLAKLGSIIGPIWNCGADRAPLCLTNCVFGCNLHAPHSLRPAIGAGFLWIGDSGVMNKAFVLVYGLVGYAAFFGTILYAIGFVGNVAVPKSIDAGGEATSTGYIVNALLLGLFAVQHTIMARPAFKEWWTQFVPKPIERSTFVLAASLLLCLMYWQWRPMPTVIWQVDHPFFRGLLQVLYYTGWALVFYSSFVIDHFDLFGLRQVVLHWLGKPYTQPPFVVRSLYHFVRHPLMVGFLLAFWSAPTMTQGRLLFSVLTTGYILLGIMLEERDLGRILGMPYLQYRQRTPMLVPFLRTAKG